MTSPVITIENEFDTIKLEDEYEFTAYISIGLAQKGDFYVKLDFVNLDRLSFGLVNSLYLLNKALSIESPLITKNGYPITHIVVTNMEAKNNFGYMWECLSDNPALGLEIQ